MWATKVSYLNDPVEEQYGRDVVSTVVLEEAEKEDCQDVSKFVMNLSRNVKGRVMQCSANYYLASFSSNSDDLGN